MVRRGRSAASPPPTPDRLALPDGDWPAPDYFTYGMFSFSSRRLRDALALDPAVIQHLPIDMVAGGAKAKDQDYRLFRPLCHQPGLDPERSARRFREAVGLSPDALQYLNVNLSEGNKAAVAQDYRLLNVLAAQPAPDLPRSGHNKRVRLEMGGEIFYAKQIVKSYFLLGDISPRTEIFWDSQLFGVLIAVDSVAERVMEAGCTGIEFRDPATLNVINGIIRYRTAEGVTEERLG